MHRYVLLTALLAFWFSIISTAAAQQTDAFIFRGVEPGVTTAEQLAKNDRWGKPTGREDQKDGSTWLDYQIRGYKNVGVLIRGGKVQTIDVTLPDGLEPDAVGSALKLGKITKDDTLPPTAMAGPTPPESYEAVSYADRRVVLYVDGQSGKAKALRVYADKMIAHTVLKPVLPGAPDVDGNGESKNGALQGQNAISRQTVMASTRMLAKYHLSRHPVDDEIGRRTLKAFVKTLDPMKMYFTQEDVAPFLERYDTVDDELRGGDLKTFYEIYRLYHQRVGQRVALIEKLLEAKHDFTIDEKLQTSAEAAAYAENDLEVNELWRKRIKYELLVHKAAGADDAEAKRRVRQRFRNYLKQIQERDDTELMELVLSALALSYDPHSNYISERKYQDFQINTSSQLYGIGASLKIVDGYVTVVKIIPKGPADLDGRLKEGDRIIGIDQNNDGKMADVINVKLPDAVSKMRGKDGTTLGILVMPKGEFESSVYKLERGKVVVRSIGHAILSGDQLPGGRTAKVGYIYLPTFYRSMDGKKETDKDFRSTTRDMKKILTDFGMKDVDVVMVDLRRNGGGSLTEAVNLPGLFLDGDPLTLQVKGNNGQVQTYAAKDIDTVWKGPLVIVTSKVSAGGSEILAGAIQDYERGLVIGDAKTHGLGTVASAQNMGSTLFGKVNPPKLGYMKLVFQKFYRPSGDSMQLRGILPDVVLPTSYSKMKLGERHLDYALKFDQVPAGKYAKVTGYGLSDALRKTLTDRSEARQTGSEFFQELAAQPEAKAPGFVSLHAEKFLATRKAPKEPSKPIPNVPGVDDVRLDGYLSEALAVSLDYGSRVLYSQAEKLYVAKQYGPAMTRYRGAAAADPNSTASHYKYAWVLATCPSATHRNGTLAVTHATKACELDEFKSWHYVLALAIAHAEAGQFSDAQKHLKTALEMAPANQKATYRFLEQRFQQRQPYQSR